MSDDKPGISPSDDPYEFEWPDDTKDERQAELERRRAELAAKPQAPLWLTALTLGVLTVMLYVMAIAAVGRVPSFAVQLAAPIALVAIVAALPIGLIVERLTRPLRTGASEVIFLVLGGALGYFWTFGVWEAFLSDYLLTNFGDVAASDNPQAEVDGFRDASSVFMMTATATAFLVARMLSETVARYRIGVYLAAASLGAIVAYSAWGWLGELVF